MNDWMSVKDVAAEMNWTDRVAYEEIRALGVPCRGRGINGVRFRRGDYVDRRDASLKPLEPRRPYTKPSLGVSVAAEPMKPRVSKLRGA